MSSSRVPSSQGSLSLNEFHTVNQETLSEMSKHKSLARNGSTEGIGINYYLSFLVKHCLTITQAVLSHID